MGGRAAGTGAAERGFVEMPAVPHALVRTLADTGARALHVGAYAERIVGARAPDEGASAVAQS
jgi:hypothetical protein